MDVFVCALFAYLLCGVSRVIKDLGMQGIDRPLWALNPTPVKVLLVILGWPVRPFAESYFSSRQVARSFVFGLLSVLTQMLVLFVHIWISYAIATWAVENVTFQILLTVLIAVVGAFIVVPLVNILLTPIIYLITVPLNQLFPLKNNLQVEEIRWCGTCKHQKRTVEYEEPLHGLWLREDMPAREKLPCKIVDDTAYIWEVYYKTEPGSRAMFPENCYQYEKQSVSGQD